VTFGRRPARRLETGETGSDDDYSLPVSGGRGRRPGLLAGHRITTHQIGRWECSSSMQP
jgi:hypothetical protein